ncbi:DUF6221 family protein [Streptomyces albidoflavus]|uniref:DUF6221 family protein n=1 Tax=unclassified Streptomyces TaxID=2593676 RepID=UPI000B173D37
MRRTSIANGAPFSVRTMAPSGPRPAGLAHALRVLAQSYAGHPDHREEWRP